MDEVTAGRRQHEMRSRHPASKPREMLDPLIERRLKVLIGVAGEFDSRRKRLSLAREEDAHRHILRIPRFAILDEAAAFHALDLLILRAEPRWGCRQRWFGHACDRVVAVRHTGFR